MRAKMEALITPSTLQVLLKISPSTPPPNNTTTCLRCWFQPTKTTSYMMRCSSLSSIRHATTPQTSKMKTVCMIMMLYICNLLAEGGYHIAAGNSMLHSMCFNKKKPVTKKTQKFLTCLEKAVQAVKVLDWHYKRNSTMYILFPEKILQTLHLWIKRWLMEWGQPYNALMRQKKSTQWIYLQSTNALFRQKWMVW